MEEEKVIIRIPDDMSHLTPEDRGCAHTALRILMKAAFEVARREAREKADEQSAAAPVTEV